MFKFHGLAESLQNYRYIFKALQEEFQFRISSINLYFIHKKVEKDLLSLNCPIKYINSNYILLDNNHLEVLPHYGLFLKSSLRAFNSHPHIVFLDDNMESLNYAEITLDGALCAIEKYKFDVTKHELSSEYYKFDSISLSFVLDRISGTENLETIILSYKNVLKDGGAIFGVTVVSDINHSNQAQEYINKKNESGVWKNKNTKLQDLEGIFAKHFDSYNIEIFGSCVMFHLIIKKIPLDIQKHKLTIENVGDKYIELW